MQTFEITLALMRVNRAELGHAALDGVVNDLVDVVREILAVQNLVALGVDDLTLLVHNVIVLEDVLAHGEVDVLDFALGAFHGLGDHLVLNGHIVAHVGRDHEVGDLVHALAAEHAHEVVLEREIELGLAGIALTAGAAAKLVIDTAGFVALGADHREATGGDHLVVLGAAHGLRLAHQVLVDTGDLGEGCGVDIDAKCTNAFEYLVEDGALHRLEFLLVLGEQAPVGLVEDAIEHLGVDAEVVAHELVARHLLGVAAE